MQVTMFDAEQTDHHTSLPGTILLGYRGSVAHGMYVPKNDPAHIDDIDIMGFVIGDPKHYLGLSEWGSRGTKEFWEGHYDCVYYDIKKAVSLLLQGNPNIMSMLWLRQPEYLLIAPEGKELLAHRDWFVGKHVYHSFAGYASAQLLKMESRDPAELRDYMAVTNELKYRGEHPNHKGEVFIRPPTVPENEALDAAKTSTEKLWQRLRAYQKKGENLGYLGDKRKQLVLSHGYDAKNAAHCIRLLRMCKEFLTTGVMQVYRQHDREELLAIKRGEWKLLEIKALAEQLFAETKQVLATSPLPEKPDYENVERLLVALLSDRLLHQS